MADLKTNLNNLPASAFEATWEAPDDKSWFKVTVVFVCTSAIIALMAWGAMRSEGRGAENTPSSIAAEESRTELPLKTGRRHAKKECISVSCWGELGVFNGKLRHSNQE